MARGGRGSPGGLRDLAVAPGAVLWGALRWPDGFGPFQAVPFTPTAVDHRVRAAVHHDGVHAVGHGEGLQVTLDGHRERQLVNQVHRRAGDDGTATQVLQTEH